MVVSVISFLCLLFFLVPCTLPFCVKILVWNLGYVPGNLPWELVQAETVGLLAPAPTAWHPRHTLSVKESRTWASRTPL